MTVLNNQLTKFLKFNTWLSGVGLSQLWHATDPSLVKEDKVKIRVSGHEAERSGAGASA